MKQEISSLEAENAEAENLRVTAEMKVVDLEEELESLQKQRNESLTDSERSELQRQIENLTQENERLSQKVSKLEELHKSSSEVGSTESFVKTGSNVDSTESFEAIAADADKADLLRKIDGLTRENGALLEKLNRFEEKGSSDTGSTESFERIPEHGESTSKLENLTRENYELVVKLTKLEEKLATLQSEAESSAETEGRLQTMTGENERLNSEINELRERLVHLEVERSEEAEIREKRSVALQEAEAQTVTEKETASSTTAPAEESVNVEELVAKLESLQSLNDELSNNVQGLEGAKEELEKIRQELQQSKQALEQAQQELKQSKQELEQSKHQFENEKHALEIEKLELAKKVEEKLDEEKPIEEKEVVTEEAQTTIVPETEKLVEAAPQRDDDEDKSAVDSATIATLESKIEQCNALISEQQGVIEDMKMKLSEKEEELEQKSAQLASNSEATDLNVRSLQRELQESMSVINEWKHKCAEMEDKLETLERGKQVIEDGLQTLQNENMNLVEQAEQKNALVNSLKEELDHTISNFETKMKEQSELIESQEKLVQELRSTVESKDQELQAKYTQLQNDLIKMDELQDELSKLEGQVQQRDATISSLTEEVETLRTNASVVEEDLFVTRHQLTELNEKLERSKSLDEFNQLMERLHEKEMHVEELEVKLSNRQAEVNAVKTQAESLAMENEQLRGQVQEEERKVTDLLEGNRSQEEELKNAERAKAEVENRLLDLQAAHEENLRHARNVTDELQNAYKMLEQLKIKHTEDTEMLNRRLEDMMEEVQAKSQELVALHNELDEKNNAINKCISEDVKAKLETQVAELEKKLTEADEKAQSQLEKMKKYAAVAKKKTTQCDELETKLKELEETLNLEKSEKEEQNKKLQESMSIVQDKDNKITEMEEELQRLRAEKEEALQNLETVKVEMTEAGEKMSALHEEMKDKARELGVRMEVMEFEYLEQLSEIKSLKAQNGFLLSKQTQINEKLENVEKESDERRILLEKLEKEKEIEETQRAEAAQQSCGQCATKVQALEAKLQERNAEIENLDNELHNSIGNLVQMQENLRLSTIAPPPDASLQESYNELMQQYNTLTTKNQETMAKFEGTLKDNEELSQRIAQLQELNGTIQEKMNALENEISKDKEAAESFDSIRSQYLDLVDRFEKQKVELEETRDRLHEAVSSNEASERQLLSRIELLEQEKDTLQQKYEILESLQGNVASEEGWGLDLAAPLVDVEALPHHQEEPVTEIVERQKREVDETLKEETPPPLFDASVFGPPPSEADSLGKDSEIGRLKEQISELENKLEKEQYSHMMSKRTAGDEHAQTEYMFKHYKDQIQALESQLAASGKDSSNVKVEDEQTIGSLEEKLALIDSERVNYQRQLAQLAAEKSELDLVIDQLLFSLAIVDESSSTLNKLRNLEARVAEILLELEGVKLENQELSAAQEVYRIRVHELENEIKMTSDSARISELENRIAKIVSERDILQLQFNDVNRAYEDLKENSDGIGRLQGQLEAVSQEKNQLVEELKSLRDSKEQQQSVVEEAVVVPTVEDFNSESMWEDDEDPWGFNDKNPHVVEPHVDIPVVPSQEIQLKLKVEELEDKLKELTDEKNKLLEEGKVAQIKNVKYAKKLKEFKVQNDNLQRQLKSQKSIGGFDDLDSAIEEELKLQIASLEKALSDAKEEHKKVLAEKEKLVNRVDVLTAAIETFTEAKEKQDTEVHIWQMRYKDIEMKLQQVGGSVETKESSTVPMSQDSAQSSAKYEEELKELKENVDALAAENEELQQLLEENRVKRQTSVDETVVQVQELQTKNSELIASNDQLKQDYETLKKQHEQSLVETNNQLHTLHENSELLKNQLSDKTIENERMTAELSGRLQAVLEEKVELEKKIQNLEEDVEKLDSSAASLSDLSELLNARVQEVTSLKEELHKQHTEKSTLEENMRSMMQQLTDELNEKQSQLDKANALLHEKDGEMSKQAIEVEELRGLEEKVKGLELSIEGYTTEVQEKNEQIRFLQEKIGSHETTLAEKEQELVAQQSLLQQSATDIQQCTSQVHEQQSINQKFMEAEQRISELSAIIAEKEASLQHSNEEVHRLQMELQNKQVEVQETMTKLEIAGVQQQSVEAPKEVGNEQDEDIPVFTFSSNNHDLELQNLRAELRSKNEEIEHLQYSLNEGTLTHTIQELQDNVNALYNEKAELEDQIIVKNQEINGLKVISLLYN